MHALPPVQNVPSVLTLPPSSLYLSTYRLTRLCPVCRPPRRGHALCLASLLSAALPSSSPLLLASSPQAEQPRRIDTHRTAADRHTQNHDGRKCIRAPGGGVALWERVRGRQLGFLRAEEEGPLPVGLRGGQQGRQGLLGDFVSTGGVSQEGKEGALHPFWLVSPSVVTCD